jgi:hypothetical protein
MVVATSASESDLSSLIDMLSILRRYSGNLKLIVFDLDLSDRFKAVVTEKDQSVEIRKLPIGMCRISQMVHSILETFSIIIWADIGYLPPWDLRHALEEYPVGTSFVGILTNSTIRELEIHSRPVRTRPWGHQHYSSFPPT